MFQLKVTTLALLLILTILSACSRPHIQIDRFLVKNNTSGKIFDVRVRYEPTLRFGAVNVILPGNYYEIVFPKRQLSAQQAVVEWRDDAGRFWSTPVALPRESRPAITGQTAGLVYDVLPAGHVAVRLQSSE